MTNVNSDMVHIIIIDSNCVWMFLDMINIQFKCKQHIKILYMNSSFIYILLSKNSYLRSENTMYDQHHAEV